MKEDEISGAFARREEMRTAYKILLSKPWGRRYLGDVGVHERTILKCTVKNMMRMKAAFI
jgi:hypothetical protein